MLTKQLMLNYFRNRTYSAKPLDTFAQEAKMAAEAGAKYLYISEIPKSHEEWTSKGGDPYPNWGMLQTSLFKLVVPKALKKYMNTEYAESNLALLKERNAVLKKHGMKAALMLIDPFYLPEKAYEDHPSWRGPRCDHPRRSK